MGSVDQAIDLERLLRERFALERFRPGQREAAQTWIDANEATWQPWVDAGLSA